jgi:SH3 domain
LILSLYCNGTATSDRIYRGVSVFSERDIHDYTPPFPPPQPHHQSSYQPTPSLYSPLCMEEQQFITALFCRAKYDYQSTDDASLSFHRGDIIEVLTRLETGWWDGLLGEERGWFPSNYVDVISDEEADASLAVMELQQQQQQLQQANIQLMPTYPLTSQGTSTQQVLSSSPGSAARSRSQIGLHTSLDTDTESPSRNGHITDGLANSEGESLPNDFWVPRVTQDGRVSQICLSLFRILSTTPPHEIFFSRRSIMSTHRLASILVTSPSTPTVISPMPTFVPLPNARVQRRLPIPSVAVIAVSTTEPPVLVFQGEQAHQSPGSGALLMTGCLIFISTSLMVPSSGLFQRPLLLLHIRMATHRHPRLARAILPRQLTRDLSRDNGRIPPLRGRGIPTALLQMATSILTIPTWIRLTTSTPLSPGDSRMLTWSMGQILNCHPNLLPPGITHDPVPPTLLTPLIHTSPLLKGWPKPFSIVLLPHLLTL